MVINNSGKPFSGVFLCRPFWTRPAPVRQVPFHFIAFLFVLIYAVLSPSIDLCIHGLDTENPAMTTTALKVNAYNSRVSSPTTSIFSPPHSPIHWKWWGSSAEPMRCNGGAPARGAWEMFMKMAWQYLGNGWTEWVQIWHTARYNTPANNACPNFEVPMHVRTCTPLFCISETTRPISLKFCIQATA